ncbi:hydroxyisourate hydrolase [Flavobacterium agricola]|uniref:5-hydroxyisourate hydrolase n=1 Tax=Flavobacterium agricola TaxID=2870839 RepID=A0ABY6M3Z4_9FLAO|nr:hydroxyisourate hydrolase [Flavobacterium agricola]UYW02275.1 hydroxyisourate hydrolase [Flavobacterium agricola]
MKKYILLFLVAFGFTHFSMAQDNQYLLSTHILDISVGKPAANVTVELYKWNVIKDTWERKGKSTTDENGRITNFLDKQNSHPGTYKLVFFTQEYFKRKGVQTFYPLIEVSFEMLNTEHYHVPITLSPFGYSTYRGS